MESVGMASLTPTRFNKDGHSYEVRAICADGVWTIRVFKDGVAQPGESTMDTDYVADYRKLNGGNAIREEMERRKQEVLNS